MKSFSFVKPDECKSLNPEKSIIIDVRTKEEHLEKSLAAKHILVPLNDLNPDYLEEQGVAKDLPVYVLCKSGLRAIDAATLLVHSGYKNVSVIEGGIIACQNAGHKIIENSKGS